MIMLRYSRIPLYYDELLFEKSVNYLPIFLLTHIGVSIYLYGSPNLFPSVILIFIRQFLIIIYKLIMIQ